MRNKEVHQLLANNSQPAGLALPICSQPPLKKVARKRLRKSRTPGFDQTSRLHAHFNILPPLNARPWRAAFAANPSVSPAQKMLASPSLPLQFAELLNLVEMRNWRNAV